MQALKLIIGNKNYSSWSMRPWLLLKHFEIPFEEIRIPLFTSESMRQVNSYSPSGLVPVLVHQDLTLWDSLAICEYIAELNPHIPLWPKQQNARAIARAVAAEMHAGFSALRNTLTMNVRARYQWKDVSVEVFNDIKRIENLWQDCRTRFGKSGDWLFGDFSIADAMYAPVATRLQTYSVPVSPLTRNYIDTLYRLPAFKLWQEQAKQEKEKIDRYEYTDWIREY